MVESLADAELVDRIARGADVRDAEAELCRRFAPRIRLYGLRHLRSEDRAAGCLGFGAGQEERGRIAGGGEALLTHLEHTDFVRRPEAVFH
jgi:hypothetical protein